MYLENQPQACPRVCGKKWLAPVLKCWLIGPDLPWVKCGPRVDIAA
jgi:hypothetical protein